MNWEQFGYLCRINSSAQLSKSDKLRLSEKASLSIYQGDNDDSELAKTLVVGVVSQDEVAAQKSATYYQCLPKLINDFKFEHKGWLVYLTFVFAFFCLSSLLYQLFVVPAFVDMYSMNQQHDHNIFDSYFRYWYVPIISLFLLLSFILSVILKLKNASILSELKPFSGLFKVFFPRKLVKNYETLIAILFFPLSSVNSGVTTTETKHLYECEALGLNAQNEFEVLLQQQLKQFNQRAKYFINKLIIVYGAVIVVSIYLFVSAAYKPLFMYGEVL